MTGAYRRAIRLSAGDGWAEAEIEDDFHRFGVTIRHDGRQVTDVQGRAARYPWSLCPSAAGALGVLRGMPIAADPTALYRFADARVQCTHLFEMAGLAVCQAARGGQRRYDAWVVDPVGGHSEAGLRRNGDLALQWRLEEGAVVAPEADRGLRPREMSSRSLRDLPPDEAEARLVLRRAVSAAAARGVDIDAFPTAASVSPGGTCFVFRPGVAEHAQRRYGSIRDFSTGPGPLTGDLP